MQTSKCAANRKEAFSLAILFFFLFIGINSTAENFEKDSLEIVNKFQACIGKPAQIDSLRRNILISFKGQKDFEALKDVYWFNLSKSLFYTGLLDEAESVIDSGLTKYNLVNPEYGVSKFYNVKASILSFKKDNENAILYFQKALKILEDNNDVHTAALIKNNIANVFFTLSNYENAYKYSNEAYRQLKKENDTINLPGVEGITAITAFKLGKTEEGKNHALSSIALAEKYKNPIGLIVGNHSMGEYYSSIQNYSKAQEAFNKSLELSNLYRQSHFVMLNKIGLQSAYLKLIEYDKSISYGLQAKEESEKLQNENTLYAIYKNLGYAYAGKSDFKKAYKNMQLAHESYIGFAGKENQKVINEILIKYDTEKKEKELIVSKNEIIENENKIFRRNQWILLLSSTLIILIFIYLFYRRIQEQKLNQIQQEEKAKQLQVSIEAEERERERISNELHDGLASSITAVKIKLENINHQNEIPELNPLINQLSNIHDETRRVSHNLMPINLNETNWVERIKTYCHENSDNKLKIRFSDNLSRQIPLKPQKSVIIYRIIQELIHNARKHSQSPVCFVQLVETNKGLSISVEDEGIGFNPDLTTGQGLISIRNRMRLINGNLEINSDINKGSLITIEINLT